MMWRGTILEVSVGFLVDERYDDRPPCVPPAVAGSVNEMAMLDDESMHPIHSRKARLMIAV
jgi:hypothetical protein